MRLLDELTLHFGLGTADLLKIIESSPARYKVYQIPKRRGGMRTIAHPARELKALQRFILDEKLNRFQVHPAAMAYVKGRGIGCNAERHRVNDVLLKLDFSEFFPSLVTRDWERFVRSSADPIIEVSDLHYYSKILFWGQHAKSRVPRCLSIGAPTSPAMSNILMYKLDVAFAQIANALGVTYTRYADDITASANDTASLLRFEDQIAREVRRCRSPALSFNADKRGLYRKGERRLVTGLVITPQHKVSLGRARKREIASLLHRASLGTLDLERQGYLKGMLGFAIAQEVEFVERMRAKYGNEVIDSAIKYLVPPRARQDGAEAGS